MVAATDFVNVQRIGPYTKGELPRPIDITIHDENDVVIDLSGFAADVVIDAIDQVVAGLGAGTSTVLSPETAGITRYDFSAVDIATAGLYRLQMWVNKAGTRYASDVFEYFVEDLTENPF